MRWAAAMLCVLLVLIGGLYLRLLAGPLPLTLFSERAQNLIASAMPPGYEVDWADFGLSLQGGTTPVVQFSPVTLTDSETGGVIRMRAIEIAISPFSTLLGRPGAVVTLVEPDIRVAQDLWGGRLASYELIEDEETGEAVIHLIDSGRRPAVRIASQGLMVAPEDVSMARQRLLSNNDGLMADIEGAQRGLADLADMAAQGQLRRLHIRNGTVSIHDGVFGLFRQFEAVTSTVTLDGPSGEARVRFVAEIAGRRVEGGLVRHLVDGAPRLSIEATNIDFAALIPFLDDPYGLAALRGAGSLAGHADFDPETSGVTGAVFTADLGGTFLRLDKDLLPVETGPFDIFWTPEDSRFHFEDVRVRVGESRARLTGDVVTGFDQRFGPTVGLSIRAAEVSLQPGDLGPPLAPLDEVNFEGWSAPLYGAFGIDRLVAAREGVAIVAQGRIDTMLAGTGLDLTLGARGASADDLKRLWPALFAPEARDWFVQYVNDGRIRSADMRVAFPPGSIPASGEVERIPPGALSIDLVADAVDLQPVPDLPAFEVEGEARITMRDHRFSMAFERAFVEDPAGRIEIANAAFLNQDTGAPAQTFEISGDVSGSVPAVFGLAGREPFDLLREVDLGYDIKALADGISGETATTIIATIAMDEAGRMVGADYALNGTMSSLRSRRPIEGFSFEEARLFYTASQEGFRVTGSGKVEGVAVDLQASRNGSGEADVVLGATLDAAAVREFGVDLSEFLSGSVRVAARPLEDGAVRLAVDLTGAGLDLPDIGIAKPQGVPGNLQAVLDTSGGEIAIRDIDLGFSQVRLGGSLRLSQEGALRAADFSTFRVSPGDDARVSISPIPGGFAVAVRGQQLDVKPVLRRFFDLTGSQAAGPSEGLGDQVFDLRVQLDRALGFYATAAFSLDLDLSVRGDEIRRVNFSAGLGGDRMVSATTNALSDGPIMTYATNDIGTLMRFVGVYPRLLGGEGTLVLRRHPTSGIERGQFSARNFTVFDEANVAQVMGAHDSSRQLIARGNRLDFSAATADFLIMDDRIEVLEAALHGDSVGGTLRGRILTEAGQYDLAGTYVPLFGLNNAFQQIPILGRIFGGRDGEGLIGVTFAVRGPLAEPQLRINPVSALAPGVFRSLFEYRASQ